jgi:hypothetical protein
MAASSEKWRMAAKWHGSISYKSGGMASGVMAAASANGSVAKTALGGVSGVSGGGMAK